MGNAAKLPAEEDILCAQYIKHLITGKNEQDYFKKLHDLKYSAGKKFFDAQLQDVYPEKDFLMCTEYNLFPFVLIAHKEEIGLSINRVWLKDMK